MSEVRAYTSDNAWEKVMTTVRAKIQRRLKRKPDDWVFSAKDFLDLGSRPAVDQALSRMAKTGAIRRVSRGLYDRPRQSRLLKTAAPAALDAVVDAVARRDDVVIVPDGAVDANQLGLTTVVPARALFWTTGTSRTLKVGGRAVRMKQMPRWLQYWSDRPAAPVVRAMHWLGPTLKDDRVVAAQLQRRLPARVARDLQRNISHLPTWMHAPARRIAQGSLRD